MRDRVDAYQQLQQVARYLATDDPHSPMPYLIMGAVEWEHMNTAELYHHIFVQQQGQLNIFDVLGLQNSETEAENKT